MITLATNVCRTRLPVPHRNFANLDTQQGTSWWRAVLSMISLKLRRRPLTIFLTLLPFALIPLFLQPHFLNRCTHIAVISAPNHGTQRLLSSAENCGPVSTAQHLWTGSNATVEQALKLVTSTSVALLPDALYNHSADVRTFLRFATGNRVPVVLLRRPLDQAWEGKGEWEKYEKDTNSFFRGVKKLMRVSGVVWDEVSFHQLYNKDIYVKKHNCYINNCDV